uniref:Uncharacterized protein n=1 Tax=Arundo donax TaxID=35708 RepID=A0A0A9A664_ARUDO
MEATRTLVVQPADICLVGRVYQAFSGCSVYLHPMLA